ncbi:MAG: tetratricopeptide repeat protein [Bacteroidetes bacterium]|nr:tetratricopeptide repeat protein [Bacteroidota bacterium]
MLLKSLAIYGKHCILFLFLTLSGLQNIVAQTNPNDNKEKLAATYFASGEYEKALELYEELLNKNRYSYTYYENYLQCLIKLENYKDAVKFTQKQSKKFPDNPSIKVDYGWTLDKSGESKKSQKVFEELIKDTKIYYKGQAPQLATAFNKRGYIDLAIQTYLEARKYNQNERSYAMELADLYASKGEYGAVFSEFLDYLEFNTFYLEQVKSRLQLYLTEDKHFEQLKKELISRLQKNPDNEAYQELLFWTFVQQKDWEGAFLQIRALDLRTGKTGRDLIELAQVCLDNEAYGTAIKCYENLAERGKDFYFYNNAVSGLLKTRLLKIQKGSGAGKQELEKLAQDYIAFLNDRGYLPGAENARLDLADLYINYLNQPKKGIDEIKNYIDNASISKVQRGAAKLKLADAYLIAGEEWEAHLLYKQIETDFANDPLGQEARFKFARLCYFRGDFEWALTQLEVLKGATTQLISNNAIELSLQIIENTGLDTSDEALKQYAKAEFLLYQNKISESIAELDSLQKKIKYNELSDDILFLKAKIAEKTGNIDSAVSYYQDLIQKYYFDILADDALISLARLYDFRLNNKQKAIETYEKLLLDYSGSLYSFEARNRYRYLKGQGNVQ